MCAGLLMNCLQEVPGMGFHISCNLPEAKPKHVLLLENKVNFRVQKPKHATSMKRDQIISNITSLWSLEFSHFLYIFLKQGNQYRPNKIPLMTVRPFEYAEVCHSLLHAYISDSQFLMVLYVQVVLKDEADVDPNDQASVLEHLDKIVSFKFTGLCLELQILSLFL